MTDQQNNIDEINELKNKLSYLENKSANSILELENQLEIMAVKSEEYDRATWSYHLRRFPRRLARSSKIMKLYGKVKNNKFMYPILGPVARFLKRYR
ncbi:MAG: hypothetical protein KW793_01155 [Candidatus Doudnabacteria bacterium]|nr:hypothetical protein [Candidatus Doudnabacteria bacterium]